MFRAVLIAALCVAMALPAFADGFSRVGDKGHFVKLVSGKALTRMGIALTVLPDGKIEGSAFGKDVTGAWRWQAGLFCRDLYFGKRDLGANCQVVQHKDGVLRFIADEGVGDYADLRLR